MLEERRLARALQAVALVPRKGVFHRYVLHRWVAQARERGAPAHILSGYWSRRTGGRFNPPNEHRTVYVALDPLTAQVEGEQIEAPYVHVPIRGRLSRVLDLTRAEVLEQLGTSADELAREWRLANAHGVVTPSQRLGRSAYRACRIEAMAYFSTVRDGGVCLAVFPDRLRSGSWLEIADPDGVLRERVP
jgi:RES domain-containing protein